MQRGALLILIFALAALPAMSDFDAGLIAYNRGDFATALAEWQPLAEQGHARARFYLGVMYANASGVDRSLRKAVELYRQAAEAGLPEAQNALGFVYRVGNGVAKDDAEAVRWYRLAAEGGIGEAQFNLAGLYARGRGIERDVVQAYKWFSIAAAFGVPEARPALFYTADQMTEAQREEALNLALAWRPRE